MRITKGFLVGKTINNIDIYINIEKINVIKYDSDKEYIVIISDNHEYCVFGTAKEFFNLLK